MNYEGLFFNYLIVYRYLKTVINMARFELKFLCESFIKDAYIKCEVIQFNDFMQTIEITINNPSESKGNISVYLDKSTAIKFAKTLRTEINKINEV